MAALQDWFQQLFANTAPASGGGGSGQFSPWAQSVLQNVGGTPTYSAQRPTLDSLKQQAAQMQSQPNWEQMLESMIYGGQQNFGGGTPALTGGTTGGGGGGGFGKPTRYLTGKTMPNLPAYMQPPTGWQQALPGGQQLPPLFNQPGARNFGIGNFRTPDYAGLLGQMRG